MNLNGRGKGGLEPVEHFLGFGPFFDLELSFSKNVLSELKRLVMLLLPGAQRSVTCQALLLVVSLL